jgi:hypothetical protein
VPHEYPVNTAQSLNNSTLAELFDSRIGVPSGFVRTAHETVVHEYQIDDRVRGSQQPPVITFLEKPGESDVCRHPCGDSLLQLAMITRNIQRDVHPPHCLEHSGNVLVGGECGYRHQNEAHPALARTPEAQVSGPEA